MIFSLDVFIRVGDIGAKPHHQGSLSFGKLILFITLYALGRIGVIGLWILYSSSFSVKQLLRKSGNTEMNQSLFINISYHPPVGKSEA